MKGNRLDKAMLELGYYNINDIPGLLKETFENKFLGTKHRIEELEHKKKLLQNFKSFESGLYVKVGENNSYIEDWTYLAVMGENYPCILSKGTNKKYRLYVLPEVNITCPLNHHNLSKIDIPKPNYIGVFNDKKIQAWLDYSDAYQKAREAMRNEATNKLDESMKKLSLVTSLIKGSAHKQGDTYYIDNKYFRIKATISKETGNIYYDISFAGGVDNLIELLSEP